LDLSWVSGSNSIAGSDGKPNNNEDTIKDLGKELEKEQLISSSINTYNLYSKWNENWTSLPTKVILMLLG